MNKTLFFLLIFFVQITQAQNKTDSIPKNYNFVLYDGSDLFSMHQFNQNYLSGYRIFSRTLDKVVPKKKINTIVKSLFVGFIGMPLTHEEGHRSVLTHKGIGSISQPFFNNKGAAYVKGVTNKTLLNLRNNDLPTYIHLHTAGLESDYMLTNKMENLLAFQEESYQMIREEYILRKLSSALYNLTTFIPSMSPKLEEETDELERDIVGHDIWGMTRHLHRPDMEFYRYTNIDDLTAIELKYAKKLAWRSFTNLFSPMLLGKTNFILSNNLKGNFALGHSLAPFGDFFEQNVWLLHKDKYKVGIYLREYMNKENAFLGGGATLHNFIIHKKWSTTVGLDLWKQPKALSFLTDVSSFGGNASVKVKYHFLEKNASLIKDLGLFTDIYYKTDGFLPEYASLDKDFGLRIGFSFSY